MRRYARWQGAHTEHLGQVPGTTGSADERGCMPNMRLAHPGSYRAASDLRCRRPAWRSGCQSRASVSSSARPRSRRLRTGRSGVMGRGEEHDERRRRYVCLRVQGLPLGSRIGSSQHRSGRCRRGGPGDIVLFGCRRCRGPTCGAIHSRAATSPLRTSLSPLSPRACRPGPASPRRQTSRARASSAGLRREALPSMFSRGSSRSGQPGSSR